MLDTPLTFTATPGLKDGTTILKLVGPVTLSTMFPLQAELRTLRPTVLILDFTDVPYIDTAGIGLHLKEMGFGGTVAARDIWAAKDLGKIKDDYSVTLPGHGVQLLILSK